MRAGARAGVRDTVMQVLMLQNATGLSQRKLCHNTVRYCRVSYGWQGRQLARCGATMLRCQLGCSLPAGSCFVAQPSPATEEVQSLSDLRRVSEWGAGPRGMGV